MAGAKVTLTLLGERKFVKAAKASFLRIARNTMASLMKRKKRRSRIYCQTLLKRKQKTTTIH